MTVVVHLLRHGEVHNPERILYGRLPGFRLSQLGEAQAELAAAYLAQYPITQVMTSPLQRARQTAAPLCEALGLSPIEDERLIEAANVLEGRRVSGPRDLLSDVRLWKYFRNPLRPSWGEPYAQIAERVMAAARSARDAASLPNGGGHAACISHQLPIVVARRAAENRHLFHDPRRRQCALASVTSLTFDGDDVVRVDYAEPAAALPSGLGAGA